MKDGGSAKIRITLKELKLYGLKIGDIIDIDDWVKVGGKK